MLEASLLTHGWAGCWNDGSAAPLGIKELMADGSWRGILVFDGQGGWQIMSLRCIDQQCNADVQQR